MNDCVICNSDSQFLLVNGQCSRATRAQRKFHLATLQPHRLVHIVNSQHEKISSHYLHVGHEVIPRND